MRDCLDKGYFHESADGSCYLCRLEGKGKCPHYGMEVFIQTHTPLGNESFSCSDHVVFADHYNGEKINPDDWNKYGKGTPGLAIVNDDGQIIANSVSYAKLIALGNDYDNLVNKRLFDSKLKTSMELIPQKSSISSVKIGDAKNGEDIYSLTRLVKCDFYKSYVLKDFQTEGKCNKQHKQDEYSCNYFKVFPGNLKNSDYYLLVDTGEKYDISYVVSSTRVVKDKPWQTAISDTIYLNDEIDFYDDDSAVVFIHLDKPEAKVFRGLNFLVLR